MKDKKELNGYGVLFALCVAKESETKKETNEVIFDIQEEEMYNYKKCT